MGLQYVDPHDLDRLPHGRRQPAARGDYEQHTVIAQIAARRLRRLPAGLLLRRHRDRRDPGAGRQHRVQRVPGARLDPRQGRLAPRALGSRGDRLAYSNGIVFLAVMAIVLIVGLRRPGDPADPALHRRRLRVVQPQPARHDPALDPAPEDRDRPGRAPPDAALPRSSTPSGSRMTAVVLVIVLVTKFLAGAWIAILAMGVFFLIMKSHPPPLRQRRARAGCRRGRPGAADPGARDRAGLQAAQADDAGAGLRQGDPAQRARGRSTSRPTRAATDRILDEWDERNIDVPLKVLHSPYREIDPADRRLRQGDPRRPTRAASSRSTSRSTSSAAGGSSCCTTRPRCGSRAGCCSRPA